MLLIFWVQCFIILLLLCKYSYKIYDYSGTRLVVEKFFRPTKKQEDEDNYKKPSSFIPWAISIYFVLFGVSNNIYQRAINSYEAQIANFQTLMTSSSKGEACVAVGSLQNKELPLKSELFNPIKTLLSFFRKEISEENKTLLKQTVRSYRRELSNAEFIDADLSQLDLRSSFLTNANLKNVDLEKTDLSHTNFKGSLFENVNITNSKSYSTTFNSTFISKTKFNNSNLSSSEFMEAVIIDSSFDNCTINYCDFSNAELTNVSYLNSNIYNIDLRYTELDNVDFTNSKISNIAFNATILDNVKLSANFDSNITLLIISDSTLNNSTFSKMNIDRSIIRNSNLKGIKIKDANIKDITILGFGNRTINNEDLEIPTDPTKNIKTIISNSEIKNSTFTNCNLTNVNLNDSKIEKVIFNNTKFEGIDTSITKIIKNKKDKYSMAEQIIFMNEMLRTQRQSETSLQNSIISFTEFNNCTFYKVNFSKAELYNVNFCNTSLIGSNFTNTALVKCNFKSATGVDLKQLKSATEVPYR